MGRDDGDDFFAGRRLDSDDLTAEQGYLRREHSRRGTEQPSRTAADQPIEELPVHPPPIEGVSTELAAFVGVGTGEPALITGEREIDRHAPTGSPVAVAAEEYFRGGGRSAWIVPLPTLTPVAIRDAASHVHPDASLVAVVAEPAPSAAVIAAAAGALRGRRALLLAEGPWRHGSRAEAALRDIRAAVGAAAADVAVYWPRLRRTTGSGTTETISPLGAVAGAIVANDVAHGVFSAPAGARGALRGGLEPVAATSSRERESLSAAGVNVIAAFSGRGTVLWGARTLSSDPDWTYIPVRRIALFLEESIERGLSWVVFEPNGERLWQQVRLSVSEFLSEQWRIGVLPGATAREAFFVRCDRETMTESDVLNGIVVCQVGFAPIRPAEFVILRIALRTAPPDE